MRRTRLPVSLFAFALVGCAAPTTPNADDSSSSDDSGSESEGEASGSESSGGESSSSSSSEAGETSSESGASESSESESSSSESTSSAETSSSSESTTTEGGETGEDSSGGADTSESSGGNQGEFMLLSAEFSEGDMIPDANTCASGSFQDAPAPSFSWTGVPEGTQSFAMVMIDETLVDMGDMLGYHSAFWNLPGSVTELPAGFQPGDLSGAMVINRGYLGPCPMLGTVPTPHTYVFTLYALPEASITLGNTLNAAFIQTLEDAALSTATLSGHSSAGLP